MMTKFKILNILLTLILLKSSGNFTVIDLYYFYQINKVAHAQTLNGVDTLQIQNTVAPRYIADTGQRRSMI